MNQILKEYEWIWKGELLRLFLSFLMSALITAGLNLLAGVDWKVAFLGPLSLAAVQTLQYMQARHSKKEK